MGPARQRVRFLLVVGVIIFSLGVGYVAAQRTQYASLLDSSISQSGSEMMIRELHRELERVAKLDAKVEAKTTRWLTSIDASTRELIRSTARSVDSDATAVRDHDHWAFGSLKRPDVPGNDQLNVLARNAVDQFIIAQLAENGSQLSPQAANHLLARRLWLGVTGLPPQPSDIRDTAQIGHEGFDQVVSDLLDNEDFGAHWAQYWLDLVQYADSNGYEEDELRPHAYPYRDFTIWAFNNDLPYDDFLRWQIAGDEIAINNPMAVAATGFLTAPPYNTFIPQESERYDELDNIVSTIGSAMIGVSVGCARCHDHPYDELSIDEYYSIVSIFKPTRREIRYLVPDNGDAFNEVAGDVDAWREEVRQMRLARAKEDSISDLEFTDAEKDILRLPLDPENKEQIRLLSLCGRCLMINDTFIDGDTKPLPEDQERFKHLMAEIKKKSPTLPPRPIQGLTIAGSEIGESPLLYGGSLSDQETIVSPGFINDLTAVDEDRMPKSWQHWDETKPRTAMANWITDVHEGTGAVAARVAVNRIWQYYFGRGLVNTPSNFGLEGESPTHPELLEWLACELVDSGWSMKHIHRLILCSATYRQAQITDSKSPMDDQKLYHGHWPTRLTAEMFRDSSLTLAGKLNRRLYGPAFQPAIPAEGIMNRDKDNPDATWPTSVIDRPEVWRRSIYIMRRRTNPIPLLQLFDSPCGLFSCPQRRDTIVPTQALALWNDHFVRRQSNRIATRVLAANKQDQRAATEQLFFKILTRRPDAEELSRAQAFLRRGASLQDLAQVLLMSNEFWYLN